MGFQQLKTFLLSFACLIVLYSNSRAADSYADKHVKVVLRMIGHQVLLMDGDSSSLVLPIVSEDGKYKIEFESEFAFNPEMLLITVDSIVRETRLSDGYILEVIECESKETSYSYELEPGTEIIRAGCMPRDYPKGCYSIEFTLPGLSKVPEVAEPVDSSGVLAVVAESGSGGGDKLFFPLVGLLIVISVGAFVMMRRKKSQTSFDPNLINLGDYRYDKLNMQLLIKGKKIDLTSKEADLLNLLHEAVNSTVERDVILNRVWGDEGDYVGRTLDVFISKLRKKLEVDPKVKILNTRGVGYKLVVNS